ncbi:MAG: type II toxin-antitoxin system RelE/ParE family toxin [Oscillibacter sp.]|nr:type II toxin-antitoxin system RelE/ParE family toxin [Oscillibacter sp.]
MSIDQRNAFKRGAAMFEVEFYRKSDGSAPAKDFIDTLDTKMKAKMLRLIDMLEQNGNDLREPYSAILGNGIFELRAKQGSNITRVLYFFVVGKKIILTNGFVKKTVKTPRSEIELAEKYKLSYERRELSNE